MSGDEVIVLGISATIAVVAWLAWYVGPRRIRRLGRGARGQWLLDLGPLAAAAILFTVLRTAAARDVRDDPRYLMLYFCLGAAWVGLSIRCLPLVGLSVRDDLAERWSASAGSAITGALVAITLCFAGGNIGDGPGWWVVVFSAGLATSMLYLSWFLLESLTNVSDLVTIDRDVAAGVRLAGFLIACGLIFGTAAAGNWVSTGDTVHGFFEVAWPAVLLIAAAAWVDRFARPTAEVLHPSLSTYGTLPAFLYIAAAALYAVRRWPLS
jgi:hypothetical protein